MLPLQFNRENKDSLKVLCIGAHSDDIEIGCGGTLIRMLNAIPDSEVVWVVLSGSGKRRDEAQKSAESYLKDIHKKKIVIGEFRDSYFPYMGKEIKEYFEKIKSYIDPDVVFTTYRHDLHQDHRLVSELTWNAFRNHYILEYEILKYDGDIGTPNTYVALEQTVCMEKILRLKECFKSQLVKPWFDEETFLGLMRRRGVEINSATRYAEAFYSRKANLLL